jgi:hypothetical protein
MTASFVNQKFDRSGIFVTDVLAKSNGIDGHTLANSRVEIGCRGDFHHLLVTALDRAIAFEKVDNVSGSIAKNLHFNVPGSLDKLLDKHGPIAESGQGFGCGSLEELLHFFHFPHDTHTAAAATVGSFEDDGQTIFSAKVDCFFGCRYWACDKFK